MQRVISWRDQCLACFFWSWGCRAAYLYTVWHLLFDPYGRILEDVLLWVENGDTEARTEILPGLRCKVVL